MARLERDQVAQNAKLHSIESVYQSRQLIISGIPETAKATKSSVLDLACELFTRMLKIACETAVQVERAERLGIGKNRFIC